jgi:NADP-dependent 3-hydroxy acid dehydrogenase YdfG
VESLAQELAKAHNITAKGLGVDVSDEAAVKAALGNEVVDVMIANAGGVVGMDHIATVPTSAIDSMIDTNIKGLIYSVQTVVPGMKERGSGHIITISSISGKEVYPGGGVYSGTKREKTLRFETASNLLNSVGFQIWSTLSHVHFVKSF